MYLQGIKQELPIQCKENLSALFELTCDEYVRRLCELWEVPTDEAWWVSDIVGGELHIADSPWALDNVELRYIVENCITFSQYQEYWEFVENEFKSGFECPRINFSSWFRFNARPEILK